VIEPRNTFAAPANAPRTEQRADPAAPDAGYADDFTSILESTTGHRSTIGCIIPAYNEEESIGAVIEALLGQSRVPDVIHVIVNNTSDGTVEVASRYSGPHEISTELGEQFTEVFVHDIGTNPDKKVGALNYGSSLVEGYDYLLGVDGDTIAHPEAVERLEIEAVADSRIGAISAICSIDDKPIQGATARFLIAGQRAQFARFNLRSLLRGRHMPVLGGQFSIFAMSALRDAMTLNHQKTPWVRDSEVEATLLSLQIAGAGYLTKISADARADVGGMTTFAGYDAQQVKWTSGAIELMWPGRRGDTKGQTFHPNLRFRWFENVGMLTSLLVRVGFVALLAGSISIDAFAFSPLWLIPPVIATLLDVRIARTMRDSDGRDLLFAATAVPAEVFLWVRMGSFVRAWARFAARKKVDNWAAQAQAERRGGLVHGVPLVLALLVAAVGMAVIWNLSSPVAQSAILHVGWLLVAAIATLQTVLMFGKLIRRQHGYKV
jgi:cellulose synthase/poly-beta-1,6-N-acetylglucosamine synthase-like glycosyltransferase